MDESNPRVKIIRKVQEYIAAHQARPKVISIPWALECDLEALPVSEFGSLGDRMAEVGFRRAIQEKNNTLFGYVVVWDAPELKVE